MNRVLAGILATVALASLPALAQDTTPLKDEKPATEQAKPLDDSSKPMGDTTIDRSSQQQSHEMRSAIPGGVGLGGGLPGNDLQSQVAVAQGAVRSVDFDSGMIVLDTGANQVQLRARPTDIASVNPGDVVSVAYSDYNGAYWLVPSSGELNQNAGSFAINGMTTGTIQKLDKSQGLVTVRGQTFHVHPEQVENLIDGQFVQIGYAVIGDSLWVSDIGISSANGVRPFNGFQGGGLQGGFGGGGVVQ